MKTLLLLMSLAGNAVTWAALLFLGYGKLPVIPFTAFLLLEVATITSLVIVTRSEAEL